MDIVKQQFAWAPDELRVLLRWDNQRLYLYCSGCGRRRQVAGKTALLKAWKPGYDLCIVCNPNISGGRMRFTKEEVDSWPENHKRCVECTEIKPFSEFHKHSRCLFGYNTVCKKCRLPKSKERYATEDIIHQIFYRSKQRAKDKNREFSIKESDIVIPEICPILNVPIVIEKNHQYAPSLDRINSSRGYSKDNIRVVSRRGNMLKNNMTIEECELLLKDLKMI